MSTNLEVVALSVQEEVIEIVKKAGELLLSKAKSGFSICHKGQIDLVTDADQSSEEYITEELAKRFPGLSILAEEQGRSGCKDAEYLWLVDPLDGTTNFAHGFPHYAISVALTKGGKSVLGVIYDPVAREMFTAKLNEGAYLNGQKLQVSTSKDVQQSLFVTGFPYNVAVTKEDNLRTFAKITKASQGVRLTGSAALNLCYVACGRVDGYWEKFIKPWDVAAGSLIVSEAGGRLSSYSGDEFSIFQDEVVASNGLLHGEMIEFLRG